MSKQKISPKHALQMAWDIIVSDGLPPMSNIMPEHYTLYRERLTLDICVSFERSWGVGCSLAVRLPWTPQEQRRFHGRMREDEILHVYEPEVELGWSSTDRTPGEALAAADLYRRVATTACLIEAKLSRYDICDEADQEKKDE